MTGPSGVDAPAADNPSMIGDPFRAFAAASQGDIERTKALARDMSDGDLTRLRRAVTALAPLIEIEEACRFAAAVQRVNSGDIPPQ